MKNKTILQQQSSRKFIYICFGAVVATLKVPVVFCCRPGEILHLEMQKLTTELSPKIPELTQ